MSINLSSFGFPDFMGDFVASRKFPGLKGFVKKLKGIGMMWLLWISPWVVGRQTRTRMHGRSISSQKIGVVSFNNAFHGRTLGAQMIDG